MRNILIILFGAGLSAGCAITAPAPAPEPLAHMVLVWLKSPGNEQDRQRVIDASMRLAEIDGVVSVKAGVPVPSDRKVVDDSFDVGLYMEFSSLEAMRNYTVHPLHRQILREEFAPVLDHYLVYDFEIDR